MPVPLTVEDLQSTAGVLLCSSLANETAIDARALSVLTGRAFLQAHADGLEAAREREARLDDWRLLPQRRQRWCQANLLGLLNSGWNVRLLRGSEVATAPHHHVGSLSGALDVSRCTTFALPSFTKPARAFWTCLLPPGTGPVGFEALASELNPDRRYRSSMIDFEPVEQIFVVDTAEDWQKLLDICGRDPSRIHPSPDYDALPAEWSGIHITTRALLRFEAADEHRQNETPLSDWAMESTAWLRFKGVARVPPYGTESEHSNTGRS